jgi:histidine triad (HIT) family protein
LGPPKSCVFCEIVAGREPAHRVGENAKALAILDINPFSAGHTLVLSKRHVPFWHDLTEDEAADLFRLARGVARKLFRAFDPEFVCLMARGRRIPHTHIFLVPTQPGDLLDGYFNRLGKAQSGAEELAPLRGARSRDTVARRIRTARRSGERRRSARSRRRGAGR